MAIHRPKWFSDDFVMISTAPTCGLTKGGRFLKQIDPVTGKRVQVQDPETGALVDAIDDRLLADAVALSRISDVSEREELELPETLTFVPADKVSLQCAVPVYYDRRFGNKFRAAMSQPQFKGFSHETLGSLRDANLITIRRGHGSPAQEQRVGEVPYIKVSDLRAGLVNINPTNRVPRAIAKKFWKGDSSGLEAFDLVCPERTSKNIGDFCVLMPGQEQVLMTREIIVLRPNPSAPFDAFYLLWAMTLKIVRDQWRRVVFMQTNREDVGQRYLEIEIPIPPNAERAAEVSKEFRTYFQSLAKQRIDLEAYLAKSSEHHFFVSGAEPPENVEDSHTGSDQISGAKDIQ